MSRGKCLDKRDPGNKSDAVSLVPTVTWEVRMHVTCKEGTLNTAATVTKVQSSSTL